MNQTRREDFDVRDILDKGMLTVDRLKTLTDIIYRYILEADGSCSTQDAMKRKIQVAIPLFEHLELDIKRVDGALRGAYDCVIKLQTQNETTAERRGGAA